MQINTNRGDTSPQKLLLGRDAKSRSKRGFFLCTEMRILISLDLKMLPVMLRTQAQPEGPVLHLFFIRGLEVLDLFLPGCRSSRCCSDVPSCLMRCTSTGISRRAMQHHRLIASAASLGYGCGSAAPRGSGQVYTDRYCTPVR